MGLFVLGVLRGLCGFCARVELGGFGACGVFASRFISLLLLLSRFLLSLLVLLSSACPLSLWLVLGFLLGLLFPFPLRTICERKGTRFCPCVLSCPVVGCISLVPCALLLAF